MTTYVAFDGDKDIWAYGYMKGWSENKRIDFELLDAHDLDNMTARARGEYYVKGKLRERMNKSKAFVLLVGESTKHLHKYVGWEIDLAVELGLPIVVVNLNNKSGLDRDNCPAKIRSGLLKKNRSARGSPSPSACAVHIPFKLAAIRHALDRWPAEFRGLSQAKKAAGARQYPEGLRSQSFGGEADVLAWLTRCRPDLPPDLRTTPAASFSRECRHRGLARRLVAVCFA